MEAKILKKNLVKVKFLCESNLNSYKNLNQKLLIFSNFLKISHFKNLSNNFFNNPNDDELRISK